MKKAKMVLAAALAAGVAWTGLAQGAAKGKAKWLVLDPITYQSGVDRTAFEGVDNLLLTKLVQAKKYRCLDRDAYNTAAREQGFGANVELVPAGYSMRGEIVQLGTTGKSREIQGTTMREYLATVSIRANDLRTQEAYESETLRVKQYCETAKDMLTFVVKRTALAILMRDYPLKIIDDEDGELTLNYGKDFLTVGEQYEVRRVRKIEDEDSGREIVKEKVTGVCEVTDCGGSSSTAQMISGKGKAGSILRFWDKADAFEPPAAVQETAAEAAPAASAPAASVYPKKKRRMAVAPFISKSNVFSVYGVNIESRKWMDDCADHLNVLLTQTDSFKVLDRTFGPEIDRELARITGDANANPDDVCRLSKKLATDYLVVAEVVFSNVASAGTDFATGLPLPPPSAIFAEIRYRCVAAPTTQIAWADTIRLDASHYGGTAETYSSSSAAHAAQTITDALQARLDREGFERVMAARKAAAEAAAAAAAQQAAPAAAPAPSGVNVGF